MQYLSFSLNLLGWPTWDLARIALVMGHIGAANLALKTGLGAKAPSVFQAGQDAAHGLLQRLDPLHGSCSRDRDGAVRQYGAMG